MYIPKNYRLEDRDSVSAILTHFPFGILVASDVGRPLAVHMPFEWRQEGNQLTLEGHVARANPIWRVAPQAPEILAIFQGPHTYISSSWYQDPNVPTWNYEAIHVYGACRVMSQEELEGAMERMLNRYELDRPAGRHWASLEPAFREQQMRAIVGLIIDVTHIEAAQKMSQNRTDADFANIVHRLAASTSSPDRDVAQVMKTIRPQLFDGDTDRNG